MRKLVVGSSLLIVSVAVLVAGRAVMSVPILKTTPDEISVTSSFTDFESGAEYRLGVGTNGKQFSSLKMNLSKEGQAVSPAVESFKQGYTSSWFEVPEIQARGFLLKGSHLPTTGNKLTFKVTVSRSEAEQVGDFYIFVAKKYGPDTWYVEDGAPITKKFW